MRIIYGRAPKPGLIILVLGGQRHAIAFRILFHTPFHTLFRSLGTGMEQLGRVTAPPLCDTRYTDLLYTY